jgi:hypothetical protein
VGEQSFALSCLASAGLIRCKHHGRPDTVTSLGGLSVAPVHEGKIAFCLPRERLELSAVDRVKVHHSCVRPLHSHSCVECIIHTFIIHALVMVTDRFNK